MVRKGMYHLTGHPKSVKPPKRIRYTSKEAGGFLTVGDADVELVEPSSYLPLYHGTSSDRVKSIRRNGLCTPKACRAPQVFGQYKFFRECRKRSIYVTESPSLAYEYALASVRDTDLTPTVVEVKGMNEDCLLAEDPEVAGETDTDSSSFLITGCECVSKKHIRFLSKKEMAGLKHEHEEIYGKD